MAPPKEYEDIYSNVEGKVGPKVLKTNLKRAFDIISSELFRFFISISSLITQMYFIEICDHKNKANVKKYQNMSIKANIFN